MPRKQMKEAHYVVLALVQDGERDFGPNNPVSHAACLELMGNTFGEPMLAGVNSRSVTGTTPAGDAALAKYLNQ